MYVCVFGGRGVEVECEEVCMLGRVYVCACRKVCVGGGRYRYRYSLRECVCGFGCAEGNVLSVYVCVRFALSVTTKDFGACFTCSGRSGAA